VSPIDRIRWTAAVASDRLPATCYRLAAHLAYVAVDGTGTAWSSRLTLARAIGCDEARLPQAFRAMEDAGFLSRGALAGPSGRQTYRWMLTIPGAEVAPPAEVAPGAEVACPGGAEVAIKGGRKSHHKGGSERGSKRGRGNTARFTPPTLAEVASYCADRQNGIDPQRFLDHYEARGWLMGKSKVKDWNACVRIWEGRDRERAPATTEHPIPTPYYPSADEAIAALNIDVKANP
jgi:hypothetical protein